MRKRRIKVSPIDGAAVYHCISRTVNREWLIDEPAKAVLRKQLRQVADFCGIEVITYTILSNHFHLLVRVPAASTPPDAEILRRYHVLYPNPTPYETTRLEVIRKQLAVDGPDARDWRKRQLALMGDLSPFMKLLKQRFAIWFNLTHDRTGPFWDGRFKSTLVQASKLVRGVAAYIDLNCVRAGLVRDPREYRFCGYTEALSGDHLAQRGLNSMPGASDWKTTLDRYQELLVGVGSKPREGKATLPVAALTTTVPTDDPVASPISTLRSRLCYLTDGGIIGSPEFVALHLARLRSATSPLPRTAPRHISLVLPGISQLAILRNPRRPRERKAPSVLPS